MFRWLRALLLVAPLPLAAAEPPFVPARSPEELTRRITDLMARYNVPGLSMAILNKEGPLLVTGLGLADVASRRPATEQTLFRLGSTSKVFVGLAVLRLVEEGRLSLDARVRDLVPELPLHNPWEATDPVRVVHLLEHSAGWDDIPMKMFAHSDPTPATLAEGLALAPEARTSRWRPGTRSSYCNLGPSMAAAIVEKVTGQRFEDYVDANLFKPLGMDTADYFLSERSRPLLTTLYRKGDRKPLPYHHIVLRPSGGLNASAEDMARLLRFFLRRGEVPGGPLLSEGSILRMETPTSGWGAQAGLKLAGYGLGSYTSYIAGSVWHGHGGHVEGGHTELRYLPEKRVAYFFSINAEAQEAFQAIDREIQGYLVPTAAHEVVPSARPIPRPLQADLAGWYVNDSPRQQIMVPVTRPFQLSRVSFAGDRLRLRALMGPSRTYAYLGGSLFRLEARAQPTLAALDEPEGRLLQLSASTLRKVDALRVVGYLLGTLLFALSVLSVLGFALVWGPRWLLGRMAGVPAMRVRVMPLLAALCLVASSTLFLISLNSFFSRFGVRTIWSMGFCGLTWAFAALSIASLVVALLAFRERASMNRWAYLHSLIVSLIFVVVTVYLAIGGWIGLRTWA